MQKQCLFYTGSPAGTRKLIEKIRGVIKDTEVPTRNMELCTGDDFRKYRHILMGILMEDQEGRTLVFAQFKIAELFGGSRVSFCGINKHETQSPAFLNALGLLYDRLINQDILVMGPWPVNGYDDDASALLLKSEFFGIAGGDEHPPVGYVEAWTERIADALSMSAEEVA